MDMVSGPHTKEEAALLCQCSPEDLCPGPMAAIDEGDKIRTIYDGSWGGANSKIQSQTQERTTAPTVLDAIAAIHWLHAASTTPPREAGALGPGISPGEEEAGAKGPGTSPSWSWPTSSATWSILKADVTKAHRRIKVLQPDWRYQIACLQDEWWINKVGTYGMASAQLYWGRLAALLLRLLYHLFPEVDWGFVFVDDFCWLLRTTDAPRLTAALLATLLALGTPLRWKKTFVGEANTWLGFVVNPQEPSVMMARSKHLTVMALLTRLHEGHTFSSKEVEQALGRIQWATTCFPMTKVFLQPFWAWKVACKTAGRPPKVVRLLAKLLLFLFRCPNRQLSPYSTRTAWWGCSDASASKEGLVYVGVGSRILGIPQKTRFTGFIPKL